MRPATVLKLIKNLVALILIFSGAYMIFFPSFPYVLIKSPWKEIIGFFIGILGLWILFRGP